MLFLVEDPVTSLAVFAGGVTESSGDTKVTSAFQTVYNRAVHKAFQTVFFQIAMVQDVHIFLARPVSLALSTLSRVMLTLILYW